MYLTADTHVHMYPCYDIRRGLNTLRTNLYALAGDSTCMGFLAERFDCNFFADFEKDASQLLRSGLEVYSQENVLLLKEKGYPDLYLFPGRQVITRERIEILSLTSDHRINDGLPAAEVIDIIKKNGGIPVLSWAPGKWFFSRKKIIQELIDTNQPGSFLIGDTTLRPTCWSMPMLMKKAVQKGFTLISGSDPLPFAGEENIMGSYGIRIDCDFDTNSPVESVRSFFNKTQKRSELVGRRGGLLSTLGRLYRNAKSKK